MRQDSPVWTQLQLAKIATESCLAVANFNSSARPSVLAGNDATWDARHLLRSVGCYRSDVLSVMTCNLPHVFPPSDKRSRQALEEQSSILPIEKKEAENKRGALKSEELLEVQWQNVPSDLCLILPAVNHAGKVARG